jgi:hypothetical protein
MRRRLFQIELPLHPGWEAIEPLRASVLACVRAIFPGAAFAADVGVVTAELLENAIKYGRWHDGGETSFALRVDGHDDRVELEVSSPVVPGDANLERLTVELRRIAAAPSPEEAYLKAVRAVALGKERALGLARASHEGGCDLSAEVVGRVVRVRAVTRRLAPPPPTPAAPA